jgi:thiamine-phosphate pyrophosphorylase
MPAPDAPERPQIYLVTPPEVSLSQFPPLLTACLDRVDVACIRIALSSADEGQIARTADALREIAHGRDVAIVIERHLALVERLGLDGVHLPDGARSVRKARAALGPDAIVGAHCGASRHEGMTAGEAGADYVSFGPVGETLLGDGTRAELALFEWWSEMIELPVVAEGGLDAELVARLAPVADWVAFGAEIWSANDPAEALRSLAAMLEERSIPKSS